MTTGADIVNSVSKYLDDQELGYEFTHWTEEELFEYLRMALDVIASTNRSKHSKHVEFPLVPGSLQTIPKNCVAPAVVGYTDVYGIVQPVRKLTKEPSSGIGKPLCSATTSGEYRLQSWAKSADDQNTVWVYPPVPQGVNTTMVVSCYSPPNPQTLEEELDITPEERAAVFELMLYYAFGTDVESVPNRERSEAHFNKAFTILGVALTAAGTRKNVK